MIVTLTLSPSLDRAMFIPALERGALIRSGGELRDPGGKGVNVARALLANGVTTSAVLPLGGAAGDELARLLEAEGVPFQRIDVPHETRSNISLCEPDGTVTKVNQNGTTLRPHDIDLLTSAALATSGADGWIVVSGSLPAGNDEQVYRDITERFVAAGRRVALDTSGLPFRMALAARPTLVKPNRDELSEVVGRRLDTIADVVEAARQVRALGAGAVLASLGADGAVYVDGDHVLHGTADVGEARSTVGAGDCLLAGFLSVDAGPERRLAVGLTWAAAAVETPGSGAPSPELVATKRSLVTTVPDTSVALSAP